MKNGPRIKTKMKIKQYNITKLFFFLFSLLFQFSPSTCRLLRLKSNKSNHHNKEISLSLPEFFTSNRMANLHFVIKIDRTRNPEKQNSVQRFGTRATRSLSNDRGCESDESESGEPNPSKIRNPKKPQQQLGHKSAIQRRR